MKTQHSSSDAEVHALVVAFETASLAPTELTHPAHIAVALAYLAEAPLPVAAGRTRAALAYFTAQHRASGYHETLTLFWMRLLDHVAQARYATLPLWARINAAVERYGTMAPYGPTTHTITCSARRRAGGVGGSGSGPAALRGTDGRRIDD
jgi:hypothetical protein